MAPLIIRTLGEDSSADDGRPSREQSFEEVRLAHYIARHQGGLYGEQEAAIQAEYDGSVRAAEAQIIAIMQDSRAAVSALIREEKRSPNRLDVVRACNQGRAWGSQPPLPQYQDFAALASAPPPPSAPMPLAPPPAAAPTAANFGDNFGTRPRSGTAVSSSASAMSIDSASYAASVPALPSIGEVMGGGGAGVGTAQGAMAAWNLGAGAGSGRDPTLQLPGPEAYSEEDRRVWEGVVVGGGMGSAGEWVGLPEVRPREEWVDFDIL